ncbi:flagellar basal body L-ring protein [Photobacterium jeanii]|uniref:Flagellar L-ring protein n=1 Tax=Photobacterium jeanii TaxID=858640 RepID=A0A178KNP1_9GAMM|nr:flagellar basal body L-ring protein FlgH [Photobacterium jeanii]OAN18830.1 flagellar basal body L-ring protein [Photobacterium jeanii]PST92771.1 flagellar basal body L-ring protein FlgH [Photobacterium jeanii]
MKKILCSLVFLTLTGCELIPQQPDTGNDVEKATTNVDAVEGSTKKESDLVDMLRRREDPEQGDPAWASVRPQPKPEHYATATGSLFSTSHVQDLYDDTKPRGIGDIVTVLLEERTQAKKSASSDLDKKTDMSMDPLALGGQNMQIAGRELSYEVKNQNKFAGSTSADQSNSIKGEISVEVIDILANGNLIVRGEKWLTLNTGDEYIRVSGTIRPDDISQENTITSTRITNARIQYSGTGDRQDIQEQGWLGRFFNVTL